MIAAYLSLSYYNKYCSLSGLNTNIYFSQFRKLGSSRSRCGQIWCLVSEGSLPGLQTALHLSLPHGAERGRGPFEWSFTRALIPSLGLHPHDSITSWRYHLQVTPHGRLRLQHGFGRDTNIQSIAQRNYR